MTIFPILLYALTTFIEILVSGTLTGEGIHLWYLLSLIVVQWVFYIFQKYNKEKIAFCLIAPLLFFNLVFGRYSVFFIGDFATYILPIKNAIILGLPFFLLGVVVNRLKFKCDWVVSLFFVVCGFLIAFLQIFENKFLVSFGDNNGTVLISTILSCCLIMLGMKNLQININASTFYKIFGNNLSFNIYVYHIAIGICLQQLFDVNGFIVFAFTFVSCLIATHFWRGFKLVVGKIALLRHQLCEQDKRDEVVN